MLSAAEIKKRVENLENYPDGRLLFIILPVVDSTDDICHFPSVI